MLCKTYTLNPEYAIFAARPRRTRELIVPVTQAA